MLGMIDKSPDIYLANKTATLTENIGEIHCAKWIAE